VGGKRKVDVVVGGSEGENDASQHWASQEMLE